MTNPAQAQLASRRLHEKCALTDGWTARGRQVAECGDAPEPQTIECRSVFGTMTCTIADWNP